MTEDDWLEQVRALAKLHGFRTYHTHRSDRSEAGWPDLVLIKPPRVLFVELKTDKGKVTLAQAEWLVDLADCGLEVDVWRPSDVRALPLILGPRALRAALPVAVRALLTPKK